MCSVLPHYITRVKMRYNEDNKMYRNRSQVQLSHLFQSFVLTVNCYISRRIKKDHLVGFVRTKPVDIQAQSASQEKSSIIPPHLIRKTLE